MLDLPAIVLIHQVLGRALAARGYGSLYAAAGIGGWILGEVLGAFLASEARLGEWGVLLPFLVAALGAAAGSLAVLQLPARSSGDSA